MRQFDVPMMRCWGCWYKPARRQIWLHGGAFDRAMAVINRHRVKGDWTAGSELQATHGATLREVPDSLTCRTRHSEVILMVAALNATTSFVEPLSRLDDADADASLLEPQGPSTMADGGGEEDGIAKPPAHVKARPQPAAPPAAHEGGGLSLDSAQGADEIVSDVRPPDADASARSGDGARPPAASSTGCLGMPAASSAGPLTPPPGLEAHWESVDRDTVPVPFGTLGQGYASVEDVKPLPAHVKLKPADHPGAGRERQVVEQAVNLEQYNTVKDDAGLAAGSTLLHQRASHPQFMAIGSYVHEEELPYVAGTGKDIEKAAIANRHFAEKVNEFGGLTGVVQDAALPAINGVTDNVLKLLKDAGRVAKEFQEFPDGYDVNSKDAADSLYKKSTLLKDFEWFAFTPGSWSKGRGKTQFSKMPNVQEDVKQKHTFFVKLNEALRKVKPRLIQSTGDEGCMLHTFDAGFLETIMFGISLIERRSVKHAGPEHLRARLAGIVHPFMNGYAISFDYGAFDASNCMHRDDQRHALKVHVENRILTSMFGEDAKECDASRAALNDRCRTFLRSRSAFWLLYTKTYGRESGDRGTSCLNFLVNLILWLAIMGMESAYRKACERHPAAAEPVEGPHPHINAFVQGMEYDDEIVKKFLRGEPCGFDLVAEGDDGLWLFTEKYAKACPGGMNAMADRIHYWSCMQGTNLEPQDETGEAKGPARVQAVSRRMEHCSRIIVPYWSEVADAQSGPKARDGTKRAKPQLRVGLLPKMRKTIEAADITFGLMPGVEFTEQMKKNVAFTKFASCAFNALDDPLMFQYFLMHARVQLLGDASIDLDKLTDANANAQFAYNSHNYVHKTMLNSFSGRSATTLDEDQVLDFPVGPVKLLKMLWERHERQISAPGHCLAMMKAVMLESPLIDEEFYLAATEGMKATATWEQCGEWARLVKARLGAV
jgi:hypothetical protein